MINGTSVRVHHSVATLETATRIAVWDEAGADLTKKIHGLTNGHGLPVKFVITPGNTHDIQAAAELLADIQPGRMVLGNKTYDANWLRDYVSDRGGLTNIPPKTLRKSPICFSPWLYKKRNLVERFFSKLKYFRRIATHDDKRGSAFFAIMSSRPKWFIRGGRSHRQYFFQTCRTALKRQMLLIIGSASTTHFCPCP